MKNETASSFIDYVPGQMRKDYLARRMVPDDKKACYECGHHVLFVGTLFPQLMADLSTKCRVSCLVQDSLDLRAASGMNVTWYSAIPWGDAVARMYVEGRSLTPVRERIKGFLSFLEPTAVVFHTDSWLLERVITDVCKQAQVPTFCVQHGLFHANSDKFWDGFYADYMLTWGDWFSKQLRLRGSKEPVVLGYPHRWGPMGDGEGLGLFASGRREAAELEDRMVRAAESLGMPIGVRIHPAKDPHALPMATFLENHRYFTSVGSTALIDAAVAGKVAVQVSGLDGMDGLQSLGGCYTVNPENLTYFLSTEPEPFPIDPKYIDATGYVTGRFLEILGSV